MPNLKLLTRPRNKDSPARERLQEATRDIAITEASEGTGLASITATLARGNIINRNNRYYSATVLERAAAAARDRTENGEITGLMDHPGWEDSAKGKPERIVIRWNRLWMNGDDLMGEGLILDTALGRDLMALKAGGVHLALSTNAFADWHFDRAENIPAPYDGDDDDLIAVMDSVELITIDVVTDPSNVFAKIHAEATAMRESFTEKENHMNELEELKAKLEAAEAAKAAAEQAAQEAEEAAERQARENLVTVAKAKHPHLPEAVVTAMLTTATAAESPEAAQAAVTALAESIPAPSNGNNGVPAAEEVDPAPFDPMREFRANR